MKKFKKITLLLVAMLAITLMLSSACTLNNGDTTTTEYNNNWYSHYEDYEQRRTEGYAAIRFSANGGHFLPGSRFIAWAMPGGIAQQPVQDLIIQGVFTRVGHADLPRVIRGGYWATWHLPVRDANGYIVFDSDNNVVLQETPWDFATDIVPVGTTDLVLFANWHRAFVFRFIEGTPSIQMPQMPPVAWQYDTMAFGYNLLYFQNNLRDLRAFFRPAARRGSHSLLSVYATQADYDAGIRMTDEQIANLYHPLDLNQPHYVTLFTRWLDGNFIFVSTAADLPSFGNANTNIFLEDNISLANVLNIEAMTIFGGAFLGSFYGNGFRVSDISLTQSQAGTNFGLFTQLSGTIRDVEFYNITINIDFSEHSEIPPRVRNIGFFAGWLMHGAVIQNVSILNSNFNIDIPQPPSWQPQMLISNDSLTIGFENHHASVNFGTLDITKNILNWWIL